MSFRAGRAAVRVHARHRCHERSPAASHESLRTADGDFVFGIRTVNRDWPNMLQVGGFSGDDQCRGEGGVITRNTICWAHHMEAAWEEHGEMKVRRVPPCNGRDRLGFKVGNPYPRPRNSRSTSTSATCATQWHHRNRRCGRREETNTR